MPYLRSTPPWFMFLVHPRDPADLHNVRGSSVVAKHSASEEEFRDRMLSMPPLVSGEVTFGPNPVRGEIVVVMCMPERMLYPKGRAGISEAVRIAGRRGARVVGLGALTAPATRGGQTLLSELPRGMTLTTGNAYTAAVATHNVVEAAEFLGLGDRAVIAVVGATGSVGVATSRLLARQGFPLILIGRTPIRVHKELADLTPTCAVGADVSAVANADIVMLVTGDPTARLTPDLPRPGSILIDLAHPMNIDRESYPRFLERDIRVVQGGFVSIPGYRSTTDLRLPDRDCVLACLAETYLFAKEGITRHSVGQASVEFALEMETIAARHDVRPRRLDLRAEVVAVP